MHIAELAKRAQMGDESARSELMERAARLVYARAARQLNDQHAVEDVAQNALLAALVALPRLRDPKLFLAWLRGICDNKLADHLARRQSSASAREILEDELPGSERTAAESAALAEDRQRVRASLGRLSSRDRLAIELFYFREMSCKEVADFLHVSHDTARAVLSRSRRKLRREFMTTSQLKQPASYSTLQLISGESTLYGGLWEHGEPIDRLYQALYPRGALDEATRAAGLTAESAEEELHKLKEMRLVVGDDGLLRCTMPIVNETDGEVIRIWAEPIADVVVSRLEPLVPDARALAGLVEGETARSTVMLFALGFEAARRPFASLRKQLGDTSPDRGRFGRFCATFFRFPYGRIEPFAAFLGGTGADTWKDGEKEFSDYWFRPKGTRRPGVDRLNALMGTERWWPVMGKLAAVAHEELTAEVKDRIAAELGLTDAKRHELWQILEEHGAVGMREGRMVVTVPRLPLGPWKDYLARLDALAGAVEEAVADAAEDLRRRAAVCSFAECFFADAVFAFFSYLWATVQTAVMERHQFRFPEEADFSWGALIVTP